MNEERLVSDIRNYVYQITSLFGLPVFAIMNDKRHSLQLLSYICISMHVVCIFGWHQKRETIQCQLQSGIPQLLCNHVCGYIVGYKVEVNLKPHYITRDDKSDLTTLPTSCDCIK